MKLNCAAMERQEGKTLTSNASHTKKPLKDEWVFKKDDRHTPPCPRPRVGSLTQNSKIEINECVKVMAIRDINIELSGDSTTPDGEEENNSKIELKCCEVVLRKINSDIVEKALEDSKLEIRASAQIELNTDGEQQFDPEESNIEVPDTKVSTPLSQDSTTEVAASMKSIKVSSAVNPDNLSKPFHGWSMEVEPRCGLPWVQQDYSGYDLRSPFQMKPSLTICMVADEEEKWPDSKGSSLKKAIDRVFSDSHFEVESSVNISRADIRDKTDCWEDKDFPSCKPENVEVKIKPSKKTQPKASDKGQKRTSKRKSLGWKQRSRLLNVRRTCRKCLKKSATYSFNIMHEQLEHPYVCQICAENLFSFIDANTLKRHQVQIHSPVSLETVSQKTSDCRALESGRLTKNIIDDVAIVAVMPKILKKNYSCQKGIKEEDIKNVSVKNGNESRSDASKPSIQKYDSNNKQTVKEEKFVIDLKSDKQLDVNKNENLPVDCYIPANQPQQPQYKVTVPLPEGAAEDAGPTDYMNNLWSTNVIGPTPATLATESKRETPPSLKLEVFNPMSGDTKDRMIRSSMRSRGGVKTRGGTRPQMQMGHGVIRMQGQRTSDICVGNLKPEDIHGASLRPSGAGGANLRPPSIRETPLRPAGVRGVHHGTSGVHGAHQRPSGVRGTHSGHSGVRGAHHGSSGVHGAHIGPSAVRGAHSGPSGVRGAYLGPSAVRGVHPGPPTVRGIYPGPSGVCGAHLGPSAVRGAHLGPSAVCGAHPRPSTIRGVHHGPSGVRGAHLGPSAVRRAHLRPQGIRGVPPMPPSMPGAPYRQQLPRDKGRVPEGPIDVPVDPANLPPAPQPKIIKVETIDISDEDPLPTDTDFVLDRLKTCGISWTRNRTPTKPKSLELPPGISVSPSTISRSLRNWVSHEDVDDGGLCSITPVSQDPAEMPNEHT